MEHVNIQYPADSWTRVYTDGSADQAVKNGGAGVYISYPGGEEDKISLATGLLSTNFKAEALAIQKGADHVENSSHTTTNIVFLSDALSVLQAIQTNKDKELNKLSPPSQP